MKTPKHIIFCWCECAMSEFSLASLMAQMRLEYITSVQVSHSRMEIQMAGITRNLQRKSDLQWAGGCPAVLPGRNLHLESGNPYISSGSYGSSKFAAKRRLSQLSRASLSPEQDLQCTEKQPEREEMGQWRKPQRLNVPLQFIAMGPVLAGTSRYHSL